MKNLIIGILLMPLIGLLGCSRNDSAAPPRGHEFVEEIMNATNGAGVEAPEILKDVVKVESDRVNDFSVLARKGELEKFPCSQCHAPGKKPKKGAEKELVHGNLKIFHGDKKVMNCQTCHDGGSMDHLKYLESPDKISYNHSYELCAQCHFQQKKDWDGGAHGKRVQFWAGPRVVNNCTSCHNPHDPSFKPRWPKTYSRPNKGEK